MNSNVIEFEDYDLDSAKDEQERIDKGGQNTYFKFKTGRNVVRILPPKKGSGRRTPYVEVWQHFVRTPAGTVSFACPRMMDGRFCKVCEKANELKGSTNKKDRDLAYDLFAKKRHYCNIIDRNEPEKGVQVASFGKSVAEPLIGLRTDEDVGANYTHPFEGFDVIVERKGSGRMDTEYNVRTGKAGKLHDDVDQMADWINNQPDLDEYKKVLSDEHIEARLRGESPGQTPALEAGDENQPDAIDVGSAADGDNTAPSDDFAF